MRNHPFLTVFLLLALACSSDQKTPGNPLYGTDGQAISKNTAATKEPMEGPLPEPDSARFIESQLSKLSLIEQFATGNDLKMLQSLLRYHGDSLEAKKTEVLAYNTNEFIPAYEIRELDAKNGYMVYYPIGTETIITTTYWNLASGSQLIATETTGCGPVCESDILFHKHHKGKLSKLNTADIMPDIGLLREMLVPDYKTIQDPLELKFELPRKGKNISFCLENNCIELIWNGKTFAIN